MKKKILIFPGSTEIAQEIWKSLKNNKEIELFSAVDEKSNHSTHIFKNVHTIKNIDTMGWLEDLNEILVNEEIDYIYPAHDYVLIELLKESHRIKSKIISSPLETCITTLSNKEQ